MRIYEIKTVNARYYIAAESDDHFRLAAVWRELACACEDKFVPFTIRVVEHGEARKTPVHLEDEPRFRRSLLWWAKHEPLGTIIGTEEI